MQIEMLIVGDPNTGAVQVKGPITDMRVVHWLLGEAKRACERMADERDRANNGKPVIVVARSLLDGHQ